MRARHVLDRVREGERELLHRRRAGLANVIAGDRDRIPVRHLRRAEAEDLGDEREDRLGRIDVRAARDVLLEDVVLDRAAQLRARDAALLGDDDVHREQRRRRRVDRHRRRDLVERDPVEQHVHVLDGVDRDADASDLAERARRVGVDAHLRRADRTRRESPVCPASSSRRKRSLVSARGAEAGVLAHRPEAAAVHRRLHAARVRKRARDRRGRARSRAARRRGDRPARREARTGELVVELV